PLPLQEFLPAQPLSPDLQAPMPLHAFMPLQACFAGEAVAFDVLSEWLLQPPASGAPATRAAIAAAINAFFSLRPMIPLRSGRCEGREGAVCAAPERGRLRKGGGELDSRDRGKLLQPELGHPAFVESQHVP